MAALLGALSGCAAAIDVGVAGAVPLVFVALGGTGGTIVSLGAVGMLGMTGGALVGCLLMVVSGALGVLEIRGASLLGSWGCLLKASSLACLAL